jgi:nucleotide-binding universal stress UspA family protein
MQAVQNNTPIALNNVLVTTDFSEASQASLPYAAALARQFGAKVLMAHVLKPEPHLEVPLDSLPVDYDRAWQEAQWQLLKFAQYDALGDLPHETVLEQGDLWTVISNLIRTREIDLIVAGSRGRQGFSRLALGSCAEKIYRRATCPVLTTGPNVRPLNGEWNIKRVLFATDASPASLASLPYALSLAEENEATLIFLQLMPVVPPEYGEAEAASVREELRRLVPAGAEAWCKPEFVVRYDFPAGGILRLARERDIDLIVMGVRKSPDGSIQDHSPWPVASQVVAEALCAVLTVRA